MTSSCVLWGGKIKSDPKQFWKFVGEKRNRKNVLTTVSFNGHESTDKTDSAKSFADYFKSVFISTAPDKPLNDFQPNTRIDAELNSPVNKADVRKLIKELDAGKGSGPDKIPPRFLKGTIDAITLPLTILFNTSISKQTFLSLWKTAFVTPIFKSGLRNDVKSYRPISILSCVAKLLDKLMSQRLAIVYSAILSPHQHAYRKGYSTVTNLVEYTTKIFQAMEKGAQIDSIYLNFSKAFDSIHHDTLLLKLRCYGVDENTVAWIQSYLQCRTQQIRVGHHLSQPYDCPSGIP